MSLQGFDWGDAGIGAAGMLALFSIAAGSALMLTGRKRRRGVKVAHWPTTLSDVRGWRPLAPPLSWYGRSWTRPPWGARHEGSHHAAA